MQDGLEYDVVDVFAERPFRGNQLAVVHGAGDLSDAQLLALAREFGFSETTFPTPVGPDRYRVRIFTVAGEIPFAGHPTLGTAWVLRERGLLATTTDPVQECGAGEIRVGFTVDAVELTAVRRDLAPVDPVVANVLLAELGLAGQRLHGEAWCAGTGLSFVHLRVPPPAVRLARPARLRLAEHEISCRDPLEGVNVYAVEGPGEVHARVFVPDVGTGEDAATGSAATGLGLVLRRTGALGEDGGYRIRQGAELGRASVLHGRVHADDETRVSVAGGVHAIASGRIAVPPRP
ncbi:MAG: PhzF family phenazine biosynthesis protein [Marmoricola sp.]